MNVAVITARMDSERLPGKALVDIAGKPNLAHIVSRLRRVRQIARVVVATSQEAVDDPLAVWCATNGVECFRGDRANVLGRVAAAARGADYILRATADCPFISWDLVDLAFRFVATRGTDTGRVWGLPDRLVPVYGAAEFPVASATVQRMVAAISDPFLQEHVFADIDANRQAYKVAYAVPPPSYSQTFYRPYRFELDAPEDLEFMRAIYAGLKTADDIPLEQVIRYVDANPHQAYVNSHIAERTGPLTSYSPEARARWKAQQAVNSHAWEGDWGWVRIPPIPSGGKPLFCRRGACYIGFVWRESGRHLLYRPDGSILEGDAEISCDCGGGRLWHRDR